MFKKFLLVFVVALVALVMTACDGERTYKADGVYTAFAAELTNGKGPQLTTVSVTIENDEIKSFYIDCTQSAKTTNSETGAVTFAFNAQSKKELGYKYGMHKTAAGLTVVDDTNVNTYKTWLETNDKKEWFEQAELLEEFFKTSTDLTTDATSKAITNVSSVTIKDGGYSTLAKEALELAKEGKSQVVIVTEGSKPSIVWATATVNSKGEFETLEIDTLQGSVKEGAWVWNTQSKQELGYKYGMHKTAAGLTVVDDTNVNTYKTWLETNNKKEWFEQVKVITDYVLENGMDGFKVGTDNKMATDSAITGVSVTVSEYHEVLEQLFENFE